MPKLAGELDEVPEWPQAVATPATADAMPIARMVDRASMAASLL
jgi:hypothetical protein